MYGLVVKEANSLLDRPVIFIDGALKEERKIIPANMDQMYIKLQSATHKVSN